MTLPRLSCLHPNRLAHTSADDDDEGQHGDPIDQSNIIQGGRRTRGKVIDYSKVAADDMEDDDEDDEEYESREDKNQDDDDQMRD